MFIVVDAEPEYINRTHDYDTGAIMVSVALIVTVIFAVTVAATLLVPIMVVISVGEHAVVITVILLQ